MKILFFGDSLTKGQVGTSFIKLLSKKYPNNQFINCGTNGDTLNIISKKLLNHLRKENDYDFIVLQGGGNDILLPFFKAKGGLFEFAYNSQIKKGLIPLENPIDYYNALIKIFREIRLLYTGKIIFITLSCLNEKLDTHLNKQRFEYNKVVRKALTEENIILADIEPIFDKILKDKIQTDYLIESFWAVTITDRIYSLFKNGPNLLSKQRNLFLTIDGAHVNTFGAEIIKDCIGDILGREVN